MDHIDHEIKLKSTRVIALVERHCYTTSIPDVGVFLVVIIMTYTIKLQLMKDEVLWCWLKKIYCW